MARNKLAFLLVGMIATLAFTPVAESQCWQPFIEPGYFNHDLQFFAPAADIDTYGGVVQRTGWFGSYARMYLGMSRPELDTTYTPPMNYTMEHLVSVGPDTTRGLDSCWGNRLDLGYMIDDVNHDHGWLFSGMHISGPSSGKTVRQQRINRLNEDDEGFVVSSGSSNAEDYINPDSDRNNLGPPDRERFYDITDSLNMGGFTSLELNKTFRVEPLNHGGILEPFFGVRYVRFRDFFLREDYVTYDDDGVSPSWPPFLPVPVIPPGQTTGGIMPIDATIEDLAIDRFGFTNDMFGGQLGIRWLKRASRWNLNSELRVLAMQNWQRLHRSFSVERTYYDGGGQGSEVDAIVNYKATQDWHATATVVGTDIRAEAAYEFTRDVSLSFGLQYIGLYTGVGRGPDINHNSQSVNLVGATFGFTVNR